MEYKEKIEEKRQKLVNTLIEFIENNPTQWEAGWYRVAQKPPFNGKSEKAYKGLNAFYLCVLSLLKGYRDPRWVTFKQAKELGGNVKKGEKSSEIFYWSFYDKATKKSFEEKTCEGMTKKERLEYWEKNVRPVIKFYQVFNAEQCENLPEYKRETTPEMEAEERQRQNAVIEQIIANSDAPVNYDGGNQAFYSPAEDSIHLPEIKDFKTMQDHYATALHEIAHSTGHESRLNRKLLGLFGTSEYAKEELRAELASVFMQVEYGISIEGKHFENHGAYLAGWLKSVKDNKNEFYAAATDAERITSYIADKYLQNIKEPKFEANNSFARQVDAVLSGADTTSTHLKIMGTPLILRQLGAQNIPVLMTAKHLKNIVADSGDDISVNYHGIDVDLIKKLPELLSDPVMVMDSLTRDDSVVIVTSAVDKENRPIIGAIKFDGIGRQDGKIIEANILASVYGKDNFENFIRRNVEAENVLYWSKEKSQELSVNLGFQLPDVLASLDSNIIIRKAKAFVNSLGEKNENIPVVEAKKAEKRNADMLERESSAKAIYLDYVKTQKENPEAIVLKRLGDFYEAMGDKAAQVAATLDLTLTGRDVGLSDRVAMCGFPYHVADEYIAKLRESSDVIVDDKYLVKSRKAQEQEILEEARKVAHEAGIPFSDKFYEGEDDFNPKVFDGSMSIEDYKIMNEMIDAEQVEQAEQVNEKETIQHNNLNYNVEIYPVLGTNADTVNAELKEYINRPMDIGKADSIIEKISKNYGINYEHKSVENSDISLIDDRFFSVRFAITSNKQNRLLYTGSVDNAEGQCGIIEKMRKTETAILESDFYSTMEKKQARENLENLIPALELEKSKINELAEQAQKVEQVDTVGQARQVRQGKKPTVVNFYAGPGAGKTTAALELTAELKKVGLNVEYVSEYAKELVLEDKSELLSDQQHVTDEQYHRLDRLRNSVDVIVTDSPVLLGIVYGADRIDDAYRQKLRSYYDSFDNIDIYLERSTVYDTKGRVQSEEEAVGLDKAISQMLEQQDIYCHGYSSEKIAETVQLAELSQEHRKMRAEAQKESDLIAEARIKAKLSPREYYMQRNAKRLDDIDKNVPSEMKTLPNWCVFKTYYDKSNGKKKKVILSPNTGEWAKCNDASTWASYKDAMAYARENGCEGLSFALNGQSRIACVDLDHCIDDKGMRSELCWKVLNASGGTYAEKSISGRGVHVFFKADGVVDGYNKHIETKGLECYDASKFMSVTGNSIGKTNEVKEAPKGLIELLHNELGKSVAAKNAAAVKFGESSFSNAELIEKIRRSRVGDDFERMMNGEDICGDRSRTDAKLMSMLAFFTNCDPAQMKSVFMESGLYRPEKGDKYIDRTIEFVISTLSARPQRLGAKKSYSRSNTDGKGK